MNRRSYKGLNNPKWRVRFNKELFMFPLRVISETHKWVVILEDKSTWELHDSYVQELDDSTYRDLLDFLVGLPRRHNVTIQELKEYGFMGVMQ